GPVLLSCPSRGPRAPSGGGARGPAPRPASTRVAATRVEAVPAPPPDEAQVAWLAALAARCERGVIAAGPLDPDPALARAVADFPPAAGSPVLAQPAPPLGCRPHPPR